MPLSSSCSFTDTSSDIITWCSKREPCLSGDLTFLLPACPPPSSGHSLFFSLGSFLGSSGCYPKRLTLGGLMSGIYSFKSLRLEIQDQEASASGFADIPLLIFSLCLHVEHREPCSLQPLIRTPFPSWGSPTHDLI